MSQPTLEEKDASEHESMSEKVMDSMQGKDEPMEVSHPEAPPLLVFASYPLVLVLGIIIALVAVWFVRP